MKQQQQLQVIEGELIDPKTIRSKGELVEVNGWTGRAVWGFLRLAWGRKVDGELKTLNSREQRERYINGMMRAGSPKRLQFIISGSDVVAVASLKHLILDPAHVYSTVSEILADQIKLRDRVPERSWQATGGHRQLIGEIFYLGGIAGIRTGVQVDGGDILTRAAVRVAVFARIEMCFNPLSFLGVSGLGRFGVLGDYERVLRIEKISELEPRLSVAIDNAKLNLKDLEQRVDSTRKVSVSSKTAITLNGALCMAYGMGGRVIKQVMDRFQKEEDKTQYGLAMAQSWTAEHGEARKDALNVPQSLSTISGATLLLTDIKAAQAKCKQWLGEKESDLAKDLLAGKLP